MGIQANELRIGNIFIRELHTQRGLEYEHEFILTEEWMGKLFGSNIAIALQDLFPIPLTPEILEKCGFEMYKDYSCYVKKYSNQGELILFSTDTPVAIANNFEPHCFYYGFHHIQHIIKYLHQLQNLYFALTNEELQVNL